MSDVDNEEEELLAADQNKYTKITELNLVLADRLQRIETLKADAKFYKDEIKKEETRVLTTTKNLQLDCDEIDTKIKNLEANIEKLELEMTDSKEQRKMRYDQQLEKIREEKERQLEEITRKKEQFRLTLSKIEEYKNNMRAKHKARDELKASNERKKREIEQIHTKEEDELIKRKDRLKEEYKQRIELEKEKAKLEAEKKISEIDKSIQQQNVRLDDEVNLQNDVIDFIDKQKETIFEENIGYKKDLDANIDTVIDYAKKQYEQNLKIKDLKAKIDMLDKSLAQIVQDFEKEKELLKYQNEQIQKEQDEDIINYKDKIAEKETSVKRIKSL